ncbi:MAG: T9SS type A sorting domain-containing protein [candidate division WOR-3 bacterium]|nr:T9SS type A sorting domain-containing protein [candidate division WOR-3 bacterium]
MRTKSYAAAALLLTIVLVAPVLGQWQPEQRLTNDPSSSYTSANNAWCVATTGERVHAVWYDYYNVYYKRSTDGGIAWGSDVRLSNSDSIADSPSAAVAGDAVHVVWCDIHDNGHAEIYYKRSIDGGENWGSVTRLTNDAGTSHEPSLAVAGDVVHVVWTDYRDGNAEIYYKRSTDGGANWGSDTRLTNDASSSDGPSVAVAGAVVHVVWYDDRDGNGETYYKRSIDGGETWGSDTRLTNCSGALRWPCVAVAGNAVHVVWCDDRDGNREVYYKGSTDGGAIWSSDTRLTNDVSYSFLPSVAVAGEAVHVVWCDDRDGNFEVYYKGSTDGGAIWSSDTRLTDATGSSVCASVAVAAPEVHVVWTDYRDGDGEIYYKRYGRRGASIAGTAFSDDDGDGERDPGERGLPAWTVKLEPGPSYTLTDADGNFLFHSLPAGEYTVSEAVKTYWRLTYPPPPGVHIVTVERGEEVTGKDFGDQVDSIVQDLAVSVAGGIARPGFNKTYAISYANPGTVEVDAAVTLVLPPEVSYVSSSPPGDYNPGTHSVTWHVGSLPAAFEGWLSAIVEIAVVPIGTELTASVTIEPLAGDYDTTDNRGSEIEVVRGSCDPNMIAVRPDPYISAGDVLDCTIYFQNVGNDTAFDIVVREVLDPGLDVSTIEPLAASHPYAFGFGAPNELIWSFNDIKLVDSITNEPASHGFLRFRIHTYPGLPPGTHVDNSAAIYFDYNEPVLTNTVRLTVVVLGWSAQASMPLPPSNEEVDAGGWLAYNSGNGFIYAAKGNRTADFYRYDPTVDVWQTLSPWPDGSERDKPSDGSAGCADGKGYIYATKGNNTQGFWMYDAGADVWLQRKDVPLGPTHQKVKGGTDIIWVGDPLDGHAYLLKGQKNEFYRYHPDCDRWEALADAPGGADRKWDKGSWLAYDGANTIYAHRAEYNELHAYDITSGTWCAPLAGMPFVGRSGKKEKSGDGGCGAYLDGSIYALKGGKTREFWKYTIATNSWSEEDSMPRGAKDKSVGPGADILAAGPRLYATKGNKSNELWQFLPGSFLFGAPPPGGMQAGKTEVARGMSISPNPLASGFAMLRYGLPKAGAAELSVYNVAGQRVMAKTLVLGRSGSVSLDLGQLAGGVYLVKLQSQAFWATQKLVVRH